MERYICVICSQYKHRKVNILGEDYMDTAKKALKNCVPDVDLLQYKSLFICDSCTDEIRKFSRFKDVLHKQLRKIRKPKTLDLDKTCKEDQHYKTIVGEIVTILQNKNVIKDENIKMNLENEDTRNAQLDAKNDNAQVRNENRHVAASYNKDDISVSDNVKNMWKVADTDAQVPTQTSSCTKVQPSTSGIQSKIGASSLPRKRMRTRRQLSQLKKTKKFVSRNKYSSSSDEPLSVHQY